jgi:hypothetical protein
MGVTFGEINEMKTAYPSSPVRSHLSRMVYITTFLKRLYEKFGDKMAMQI